MNNKPQVPKIFETLVPFMIAGIALALFVGMLFLFSYVIIWGLIIGAILWAVSLLKQFIFSRMKKTGPQKRQGITIEHDGKK